MKVRDVLRLLKDDGWYLSVTKAAIANLNIRRRKDELRFQENQMMIYHTEH